MNGNVLCNVSFFELFSFFRCIFLRLCVSTSTNRYGIFFDFKRLIALFEYGHQEYPYMTHPSLFIDYFILCVHKIASSIFLFLNACCRGELPIQLYLILVVKSDFRLYDGMNAIVVLIFVTCVIVEFSVASISCVLLTSASP